jgi:hypothetical protein
MRAAVVRTRTATESYERTEVWARASGVDFHELTSCVCSYIWNGESQLLIDSEGAWLY